MTALDRIQVKGFKSIRELELKLRPLNVLIGANGSGKSNLIQVFEMLNYIVNERLQKYVGQVGGADNLLYFGRKQTEKIEFGFYFLEGKYELELFPTNIDSLHITIENTRLEDGNLTRSSGKISSNGHAETTLNQFAKRSDEQAEFDKHLLAKMRNWKVYQFHDTSDSARIKQTHDIEDNRVLHSDGSNLAAFLYYLKQKQAPHYHQIVSTIRLVAPFFDDFILEPSRLNPDKIRLEWREKNAPPDTYFSASMLSDGTLRFMSLATLLLQPDLPSAILIDEPELGLHPFAITTLAGLLGSASTKTQVIVATQSVPLVNQFIPEDLIVVDRKDGQSTFHRPDSTEIDLWLEDYGLGDLWEKNIIGGRPQR